MIAFGDSIIKSEKQMSFTIKDFGPIHLSAGSHTCPLEGMCVMEMVSFLAGEKWSDRPACSSAVISKFAQIINDKTGQEGRDHLQLYIPKLLGTASPKHEKARCEYLVWQSIRVFTPIVLEVAELHIHAERLRRYQGGFSSLVNICEDATTDAARATTTATAAARAAIASKHTNISATARRANIAALCASNIAWYAANDFLDESVNTVTRAAANATATVGSHADAKNKLHQAFFETLDTLIDLGPSGEMEPAHVERIPKLHKVLELS